EAMLDGLERVPRAVCSHRGGRFEEMDLGAVLARRPRAVPTTSWPTPRARRGVSWAAGHRVARDTSPRAAPEVAGSTV
ncbi:hypothetical protein AB0H36_16510, partial [Kribbella sp. NPDC050820]|uniref:hypothetical protein n=1 Tax=Kribbella sp. NPDC050820 TaxID=3155408 RepID=UPI0033EA92D3